MECSTYKMTNITRTISKSRRPIVATVNCAGNIPELHTLEKWADNSQLIKFETIQKRQTKICYMGLQACRV